MAENSKEESLEKLSLMVNKKKILIDLTFLFDQYAKRGIGRYGNEVLKRLIRTIVEQDLYELHFIGFLSLEQNLIQFKLSQFVIDEISEKVYFHSIGTPFDSTIKNIQNWYKFYKPVIERVKPDLFYAIHFERGLPSARILQYRVNYIPKTIVMAHDAIPLVMNKFSSKGFVQNTLKRLFFKTLWKGVQDADIVLTNSDYSKKDLIEFGKVDEHKIKRIYLGIDESFYRDQSDIDSETEEKILEEFDVKGSKYFFYDSGLEANKGADNLLNVLKLLFQSTTDSIPKKIVIVGGDFYAGEGEKIRAKTILGLRFITLAKKLGILENIIATDRITDDKLKTLLFNSTAYINLSKYEGFSFGPLQAMAAGVVPISSNTSCIPEITKGGALLVDGDDYERTARQIINLLESDDVRENILNRGAEVVREYDWDTTALLTLQEFVNILGK